MNRGKIAAVHVLLFIAAAAAIGYQVARPGYYMLVNFDAAIGPKFTMQFMESFRQGVLYPRWMADSFYGFGSPTFVFYSPLLYFLTALLSLAGMDMPLAFSFLYLAGLYAGGACMFYLVRKRYGDGAGIVSGLCFILLPTRIADFYLLNTLAGRFAQAWLPAVLLAVDRYMDGPFRRRNLAFLAVAYAGLVMSHVATAFIFTPLVVAFGLLGSRTASGPRRAARLSGGILAGLCLAAVYFLPALVERGYAQIEHFQSAHDFRRFFLYNIMSVHDPVPIEGMLTIMRNTVSLELCFAAVFLYLGFRTVPAGQRRWIYLFAGSVLACLFMMSSPSAAVWEHVPGVSTVGYPARYGALHATFLSALIGVCSSALVRDPARYRATAAFIAAFFIAVTAVDAFIVANSHRYSQMEAASISPGIVLPEYLPRDAELDAVNAASKRLPLFSSDRDFTAEVGHWGYVDRLFTVDADRSVKLRVKTLYFPGWRAWVDGEDAAIGVEDKTGAILIDVPKGRHEVELRFTDTPPRTAGALISLLMLAAFLLPYGRLSALLKRG